MEAGTGIALGALVLTLATLFWNRRGHVENLSLSQLVAANAALDARVTRTEVELSRAEAGLRACEEREARLDARDSERLRRIIRLEDVVRAAGLPLP